MIIVVRRASPVQLHRSWRHLVIGAVMCRFGRSIRSPCSLSLPACGLLLVGIGVIQMVDAFQIRKNARGAGEAIGRLPRRHRQPPTACAQPTAGEALWADRVHGQG
jgi:hypothetical protein